MKDNGRRIDGGKLKKEYYGIYAEYLARFIEAYSEEGIEIFAVTLQNEPKARQTWESCFYTAREEADFAKTLKKVFAERGITAKILCWDHNKERLFERADTVYSLCGDIVDGAGFHWYSGEHFGAIAAVKAKYPEKLALATEFCVSSGIDEVNTGYAEEILGDLSNGADGIVEWNLILDDEGGPFHNRKSGCAAPLRYDRSENRVKKSGIYNKIYAFSHFIEKGAKSLYTSSFDEKIKTCAVKNPNGDIILTVLNSGGQGDAYIYVNGKATSVFLKAGGLYTFVIGE